MSILQPLLTRYDKLNLASRCVKSATAVAGGSLVLSEGHPYWTIFILAIGGIANEFIVFVREKEVKLQTSELNDEIDGLRNTIEQLRNRSTEI